MYIFKKIRCIHAENLGNSFRILFPVPKCSCIFPSVSSLLKRAALYHTLRKEFSLSSPLPVLLSAVRP